MCLGNNYKVTYISCLMYMTQRLTKGRKGYIFNYYFKMFMQDHRRATFKISNLPGEPEYSVNGGTTVSGGRTVLSAMAQQSFSTLRRPFQKKVGAKSLSGNVLSSKTTFSSQRYCHSIGSVTVPVFPCCLLSTFPTVQA